MKTSLRFLIVGFCCCVCLQTPVVLLSQAVVTKWILNNNGAKASYWENTATGMAAANYVFRTSSDSADVLKMCYTTDYVYVRSHGLTQNMGRYLNPGGCLAQNYTHRIPRTSTVPTTKTISPKVGAIGLLLNGIPMYGLSNASSWSGTTNTNGGSGGRGIWNVEVYKSEGFVLDTAFGAHPQQQGAYHSHATPFRLYKSTPTTQHSPLIGFAFDGYPVYGPYGYVSPTNAASGVTRMKSGYSLRNITTRTTLPYGVALTSEQYGPAVNTTYPIGTYCEDYEWLASNGGDLDKYNGRFCVTPDYPNGTYAYFTTINAAGVPAFPYLIGIEYYGAPDTQNFPTNPMSVANVTIPATATNCLLPTNNAMTSVAAGNGGRSTGAGFVNISPQPSSGEVYISTTDFAFTNVEVMNMLGQVVYTSVVERSTLNTAPPQGFEQGIRIELREDMQRGAYMLRLFNANTGAYMSKKIMVE